MIHLEHLHTSQPIGKTVGPRIVAGSHYHQLLSPPDSRCSNRSSK